MAEVEIVVDDDILAETTQIATQMGLSVDEVLDILLRKFNTEGGFFFPVESIEKH